MKNNALSILGTACLVLVMGSSITSCSVEDGVDGINGVDGTNGVDGADGQNGADGHNGADGADGSDGANGADAIGLEEFADYGSIALEIQGIRPDNVPFDQETELEFISPELHTNSFQDNDPNLEFDFLRLVDAPNVEQVNGVDLSLYVGDNGLPSQYFEFEIEFSDFAIFSDDLKYILLQDSYFATPAANSTGRVPVQQNKGSNTLSITEYSFDDTTNNLKFSFAMNIIGADNETGKDLSISGTVDVILFENVSSKSRD